MVRGYHVYNADIWASVVARQGISNSHLVGGILADRCSVNLAYCHLSHFPQARYRRCRWVHWSLEGHSKASNTVTNTIACSLLPRVLLPIQNLTLKFQLLKFSHYLFKFVSRGFI